MPHILRKHITEAAKSAPADYERVCMIFRDPSKDTVATIFITAEGIRRIAEMKAKPTGFNGVTGSGPPSPSTTSSPTPPPPPPPEGAGHELKKLLSRIGITPAPTCACNSHAREMDQRGTAWCEDHIDTIVGWLREEANRRKLPFLDAAGRAIVRRSIRNARAARAPRYAMHLSSTGLGDAVCGYYAACGLAESTGERVIYYAHSDRWLARADHPGVEVRERIPYGIDASPHNEYWDRVTKASSFAQAYCDRLARELKIAPFTPRRPHTIDTSHTPAMPGGIIIAPFACFDSRNWPHFSTLIRQLTAQGHRVTVIGSTNQRPKLEAITAGTSATWIAGESPAKITNLMLGAELVIGNDSGIAHLGGLLGTRTIAVHAGAFSHDFLFEHAPTVTSITPGLTIARGDHNTAALAMVTVEMVMGAVRPAIQLAA